jgi:hypothetical protein
LHIEHELDGDGDGDNGDDGDDGDDDDDDDVTLADVVIGPVTPQGITPALSDPTTTLSGLDPGHTVSSTNGIGVVGAISGQVSSTANGFSVTNGEIGIVAPDANTGMISGLTIGVDADHTATVSTTPNGDISVSFSTNI